MADAMQLRLGCGMASKPSLTKTQLNLQITDALQFSTRTWSGFNVGQGSV